MVLQSLKPIRSIVYGMILWYLLNFYVVCHDCSPTGLFSSSRTSRASSRLFLTVSKKKMSINRVGHLVETTLGNYQSYTLTPWAFILTIRSEKQHVKHYLKATGNLQLLTVGSSIKPMWAAPK